MGGLVGGRGVGGGRGEGGGGRGGGLSGGLVLRLMLREGRLEGIVGHAPHDDCQLLLWRLRAALSPSFYCQGWALRAGAHPTSPKHQVSSPGWDVSMDRKIRTVNLGVLQAAPELRLRVGAP